MHGNILWGEDPQLIFSMESVTKKKLRATAIVKERPFS